MILNAAIIGCGNIAGRFDMAAFRGQHSISHAGAITQNPNFRLIYCSDPNEERLREFKDFWHVPFAGQSLDDIFKCQVKIDVVIVCSPKELHLEHLTWALELQPKMVVCEKPMTGNLADANLLVEKYRDKLVPLTVNFSRRWDPDIIRLKEGITSGVFGQVASVSAIYNKGLINNGSHLLDLISFLFGSVKLVSRGNALFDFFKDDPSIPMILEAGADIPVVVNVCNAKYFSMFEIEFFTEKGTISMNDGGLNWSERSIIQSEEFRGYLRLGERKNRPGRYMEAMGLMYENVYQHILSGRVLSSNARSALDTQKICHDVVSSLGDLGQKGNICG